MEHREPVSAADVLQSLQGVRLPDGRTALVGSARLSDIVVSGDKAMFSIVADPGAVEEWERVRVAAQSAAAATPGLRSALVTLTAEIGAGVAPHPGRSAQRPRPARSPDPTTAAPKPAVRPQATRFPSLAGVRRIVAIASGKGGVGKSTTAANLALALRGEGWTVGVLDADIYGPSMPRLLGLRGQPRIVSGKTIRPLEAYGCRVMSIGLVVEPEKAMVWRGPMVASAITQMLRDVEWGELDVLVVDMPPGTGDAQLTLSQAVPLSGAVVVSTPQDLALLDARRGVAMFREVAVPVLGLIENMSYFVCDECGKRHEIFAHGGARAEATKLGVPFLGEIPLAPEIRERSDGGVPVVIAVPEGPHAAAYRGIARLLARSIGAAD